MPHPASTNQAAQRASEERHLCRFLELAGLRATWVHGDRPDFVLQVDGRPVGLEHQELTERDLASTRENIARLEAELRAELGRRGADRDLAVGLSVDAANPLFRRWRDLEDLPPRIAALAVARSSSVTRSASQQVFASELRALGVVGPEFVHLSRTSGAAAGPLATVTPGFWGPGEDGAIRAIRSKEERLPAYRAASGIEEQWLLLVTGEGYAQATDSVMTEWIREPTAFDRVYLMDLRARALQRLDAGARTQP